MTDKTSAELGNKPPLEVACPSCREPALYAPSNPWRPFCSERCRSVDLGAWASERFRVAADPAVGDDHGGLLPPAH